MTKAQYKEAVDRALTGPFLSKVERLARSLLRGFRLEDIEEVVIFAVGRMYDDILVGAGRRKGGYEAYRDEAEPQDFEGFLLLLVKREAQVFKKRHENLKVTAVEMAQLQEIPISRTPAESPGWAHVTSVWLSEACGLLDNEGCSPKGKAGAEREIHNAPNSKNSQVEMRKWLKQALAWLGGTPSDFEELAEKVQKVLADRVECRPEREGQIWLMRYRYEMDKTDIASALKAEYPEEYGAKTPEALRKSVSRLLIKMDEDITVEVRKLVSNSARLSTVNEPKKEKGDER